MSIADLKASYDFVLILIQDCKDKAIEKEIAVEEISVYQEHLTLEDKLYQELMNRLVFLA